MKHLTYLISILLITSCYVNTIDTTIEPSSYQLEKEVEKGVRNSITTNNPNKTYRKIASSEVYENKPQEINELESKIDYRNSLNPLRTDNFTFNQLDNEIEKLKDSIRTNKIHTTYEIDHWYSVDSILYDELFILYPNYKIKNTVLFLEYQLMGEEYSNIYNYFKKRKVYNHSSYEIEIQMNNEQYRKWDQLMLNDTISKNEALITVLAEMEYIKEFNNYNKVDVMERVIQSYIRHNMQGIYNSKTFHTPNVLSNGDIEVLHEFSLDKKPKIFYFVLSNNLIVKNLYVSE